MLTAHGLCASSANYDFNVYFWDEKLGKQKENYPNFLKIPINIFFSLIFIKKREFGKGGGEECLQDWLTNSQSQQPLHHILLQRELEKQENSTADCHTATEPLH